MILTGLDLAREGDRTVVTTSQPQWWRVGDRVRVQGVPNSVRHWVSRRVNSRTFEVQSKQRPSKGFRKHLRRQKSR